MDYLDNANANVSASSSVVSEATQFMNEHYMEALNMQQIAEHCHLSQPYFYKVFFDSVHMTPNTYLETVRLSRAKKLLLTTDLSISEISARCGFNSQAYFSSRFKKSFDTTPREYRDFSSAF